MIKVGGNIDGVFKAYKASKVEKKDVDELKTDVQNKTDSIKDKVTLSAESKIESRKFEVDFIKRRIGDVAATREDKVSDIKQRIKDGTYNIDLEKVADAILNRVI